MMRRWLSKNQSTVNNFMVNKGFVLDSKFKWWFHDSKKLAISLRDASKYSIESLTAAPFQYKIDNFTFLSSIKLNIDCLDTIYRIHYR